MDNVYDFVRFFKFEFFSQTWTDVSKNSSKTAKNTEKWYICIHEIFWGKRVRKQLLSWLI